MATKQSMLMAESMALRAQGVLAIIFGAVALFWPSLTIKTLGYLFAAFLVADALVLLVTGLMNLDKFFKAIWLLLLGALELGFGAYLFHHPSILFHTLVWLLGLALIARGAFSFIHAFTRHLPPTSRMLHGLLGVLGLIVGIIIVREPGTAGVGFVWILGLYALLSGPMFIAMAADIDKIAKKK